MSKTTNILFGIVHCAVLYHFSSKVEIVISTFNQETVLFNFRLKVAFVSDKRFWNNNILQENVLGS